MDEVIEKELVTDAEMAEKAKNVEPRTHEEYLFDIANKQYDINEEE